MTRMPRVPLLLVLVALALTAVAPSAEATPVFEAPSYPAEITGASSEGARGFSLKGGEVACETSHFEGTLAEASSTLSLVPTYESCVAMGSIPATVTTTGCEYQLHATEEVASGVFDHDIDVVCESGKAITVTVSTCVIEIGPQSGLTAITTTNLEGGELTLDAEVSGYHYVGKGFLCGLLGIGTGTDGEYFDHVVLSGEVGVGEEPAPTTLTTSLSGEGKSGKTITVNEGAKVKDQATLSGANASEATGTVKYLVYADSECKELVTTAGEVSVSGGSVPASGEVALTAGAIYYWKATYSGDSKNQASVSACGDEVLTVKAAVTLSTTLAGRVGSGEGEVVEGKEITVPAGAAVADTATLSGTNSSKATGFVEYLVYADEKCEEQVAEAGEASVEAGVAGPSEEMIMEAGTRYWRAFYGGGPLHQSAASPCDEIVTAIAPTSLATTLSGEGEEGEEITVSADAVVTDSAILSGPKAAEATGTVEYFVYADEDCEELVKEAGEVEVEGASVPASSGQTLEPGIYYWQAVYSGDGANYPSTSPCGVEIEMVLPRITTELSGGGSSGEAIEVTTKTPVTDQATIHGENAAEATGTVEYFVYADEDCEELVKEAGEVEVEGAVAPASEPVELEEPGTYFWQADYSGDEENPGAVNACGSEILSVVSPTTVTTTLTGGEEEGAEIEVEEGTPVSDEATLSGAKAATAKGVVSYFVYADNECTELAASAGEGAVVEGAAAPSEAVTLPHGTYYWQAEYRGDGVNQASVSPCGGEIEVVTAPITTMLSGEDPFEESVSGEKIQVAVETPVTDQATLHGPGATEAAGTVEYFVYADEDCEELVTSAGEMEVEGAVAPPSEPVEFEEPGFYYWQAVYSDEEKTPVATSTCGAEEVQAVKPDTWKYAALGDSFSSGEGVYQAPGGTYYPFTDIGGLFAKHVNRCHRSEQAWPALVAEAAVGKKHIEAAEVFKEVPEKFIFRACSGAKTTSIWDKTLKDTAGQYEEFRHVTGWFATKPSQARWLLVGGNPSKDTTVVSLTIGGNDAGFVPIAEACVQTRSPANLIFAYSPASCLAEIASWEAKGFKAIEEKLPPVLEKIRERAPAAKILLFKYPRVLNLAVGYIPIGPSITKNVVVINNTHRVGIGPTAAGGIEAFILRLNAKLEAVAKLSGVKGVEVRNDTVGAFAKHRLGNTKPWINGAKWPLNRVESLHPEICGHKALAAKALPLIDPKAKPITLCP
jgi:GDSL-like Lipase/Acylhydrolase family